MPWARFTVTWSYVKNVHRKAHVCQSLCSCCVYNKSYGRKTRLNLGILISPQKRGIQRYQQAQYHHDTGIIMRFFDLRRSSPASTAHGAAESSKTGRDPTQSQLPKTTTSHSPITKHPHKNRECHSVLWRSPCFYTTCIFLSFLCIPLPSSPRRSIRRVLVQLYCL